MSKYFPPESYRIAERYRLISTDVTQDTMLSYLSKNLQHNYICKSRNLAQVLRDKSTESRNSTMSICAYMNPYTPNKRLAIIHSTGTGKTRKSLLAALSYNRDLTIVAVHNIQITPFINEMMVSPEIRSVYPGYRKRMDMITCKSIATSVDKGDRDRLDYYFKDRVVILDEMHHVKNSDDRAEEDKPIKRRTPLFDSVISVLSDYPNSIVLFLTATPLVDRDEEIYGIYKLLKGRTLEYSGVNTSYIARTLAGYVSWHKDANLPQRNVEVRCLMEERGKQWELYQKHQFDKSSVHCKTSAISRFLTNDDAEASELRMSIVDTLRMLPEDLRPDPKSEDYDEQCVESLKYISVKLYKLIQQLKKQRGKPKLIYDSWKKRGGMDRVIEALSLPAVGYVLVHTVQEVLDVSNRGLRMLALHKLPQNKNLPMLVNQFRDLFNSEENRDGQLIDIILGTPKFSESISLRNAFSSHILTPMWNVTTTMQVRGRCNRKNSLPYLSNDDPNKKITNYSYVLYKPGGFDTIESSIIERAKQKFSQIEIIMQILSENKIERLFDFDPQIVSFDRSRICVNDRINYMMRICSDPISYRNVNTDLEYFIKFLEIHDNLFDTMKTITTNESGYTRFINVAIQTLEYFYILKKQGKSLTQKQQNALDSVSKAFVESEGLCAHVLYFTNNDTVEYQRLVQADKKVIRCLDTSKWRWMDETDKTTILRMEEMYNKNVSEFVESIHDMWQGYKFYVVKYTLLSCYRIFRYKDVKDISKQSSIDSTDGRKTSRGEKWQYFNKQELATMYLNICDIKHLTPKFVAKSFHIGQIFRALLDVLESKNMVLEIPI